MSQIIIDGKNYCVELLDGSIVVVEHFYYNSSNKKKCMKAKKLIEKKNQFEQPIPSTSIGLFNGNFSEAIESHFVDEIVGKCIFFEFEKQFSIATLLHKNEKYGH